MFKNSFFFFIDKMRILVLFVVVCIVFVFGDIDIYNKYYFFNKYLGGFISGKYLGGSNYYRNRY